MYLYPKKMKMKKFLFPLLASLTLLFNCDVADKLTKFDLNLQTNYTIEPTVLVDSPFNTFTPDVTTESESTFQNNNTNKDLIESIKLSRIQLTIDTPADGNFNFLKEIHVYIEAEGLEEIEIANRFELENSNSLTLGLDVLGQELKEYLKKDSYSLRVQTTTDETISETHEIIIDTRFRVDAKILGI